MDQLTDLQAAINASPYFNGQGQTYEIAGDLCLPDHCALENINLVQLDQTDSRRTVKKIGGCDIRLRNVSVNVGSDSTLGNVTNSAGIWISGVNGVSLDEIDITGNGKLAGILLYGLVSPKLGRLRVHDMQFSAASDPGSEQLVGIWLNNCSRFTLPAADVSNITSVINGVTRAYQTDGIDCSGCHDFSITTPFVSMCGEGLDISGSAGNARFSVIGGHFWDIDSWGLKLCNSASSGVISDVIVRSAGYGGFTVGGASQSGLPHCENIQFIGCRAINTGSNGNWASQNTAGFSIMNGIYDAGYPMGVQFISCTARDTQGVPTMKYGFVGQPAINSSSPNKMINCASFGYSIATTLGNFG